MTTWHWWTRTDAGLAMRICIGVAIFAVLAGVDLARRGGQATRWREYLFLMSAVGAALVYGAVNDQISSRVSWEYFFYGKEISKTLGPEVPPNFAALHWEAAKIGMQATWTAGLIIGACLLIANNPRRDLPRLHYAELLQAVGGVFIGCAVCGLIGGISGWNGLLNWISPDFRDMWTADIFRPRHFLCTFGIHLGGYVGGLLGTIIAVVWVNRTRSMRKSRGEQAHHGAARDEPGCVEAKGH